MDENRSTRSTRLTKAKPWIFVGLIVASLLIGTATGLDSALGELTNWSALVSAVNNNLLVIALIYVLVTAVGCSLLAVPGIVFALIAGALFGPILGTFLCVVAATIGASIAFVMGRYFLKDTLKPKLEANQTLSRWLFGGSNSNVIVLLAVTRLVPLFPFNLQNYAYGVTDVSLRSYTMLSFLFMIPGTAMYTFAAAGLVEPQQRWLLFGAAAAIAVAVFAIGWLLKRKFLAQGGE